MQFKIYIGKYCIRSFQNDSVFLEQDDGEGMEVKIPVLEQLLDKFYKENF